jgi:hypothetical protein
MRVRPSPQHGQALSVSAVGVRRRGAGAFGPLGPASEGDGQQAVELPLHLGQLAAGGGQLAAEFPHHRVQGGHVGRQRVVVVVLAGHAERWDTTGPGATVTRRAG